MRVVECLYELVLPLWERGSDVVEEYDYCQKSRLLGVPAGGEQAMPCWCEEPATEVLPQDLTRHFAHMPESQYEAALVLQSR